jgi:hypothetical protein
MSTLQVSEKTARLCASVAAPAPIFEVFDGTMLPIAEMPSGMTSNLQKVVCVLCRLGTALHCPLSDY